MRLWATIPVLALTAMPLAAQTGTSSIADRSKGSPNAPVTVYEMSDFQCPYCQRHALQTFPELEKEYVATGKVRWVFINFPLTQIHANALAAAEFSMCAARQGKFWPAHDVLFRTQQVWAPLKDPGQFLMTLSDSIGLNRSTLLPCLKNAETRKEVQADATGAARSGAQSTPTFYIEGGLMAGAAPVSDFRQILDSIYAVKTAKKAGS